MRDYGLTGVQFASYGVEPFGSSERLLVKAGASSSAGRDAARSGREAREAAEAIRQAVAGQASRIGQELEDAALVFISIGDSELGLKGAIVVADITASLGVLTVGVVSQSLGSVATSGDLVDADFADFSERVNTLMIVSPQDSGSSMRADLTVMDVYSPSEQAVLTAVQAITNLVLTPGLINLDFDDVKAALSAGGRSLVAEGHAKGLNRALRATEMALAAPNFEHTMAGARQLLLCIEGPSSIGLTEINEAASLVSDIAHDDATIIFGAVIDDALDEEVRITVLASGIEETARKSGGGSVDRGSGQSESAISPSQYKRVMLALHRVWAPGVAEDWLKSPNAYLSGARPMDALRDGDVQEVIRAIEASEAGAFS
ncbi:hypothetical protein ACI8AK_14950 [Geodermatophilus sp. SYSU D00867]